MKIVLQRVKEARVEVGQNIVGQINQGLLIFLAVAKTDTVLDADYLVDKIAQLRVFEDSDGKMNLSSVDTKAEFLVVSQFTLYGDCLKGRRPSFDRAADPKTGEELYNYFVSKLRKYDLKVETGRFRAMMNVFLVNDGPVTFILESQT